MYIYQPGTLDPFTINPAAQREMLSLPSLAGVIPMRLSTALLLAFVTIAPSRAQQPAASTYSFQVATIRPSDPSAPMGGGMQGEPRRWTARTVTVFRMMVYAFDAHPSQFLDAPAWTKDERFDIDAVPDMDTSPTREQFHAMVRSLLIERFGLHLVPAMRTLPVYAVRIDKNGPKLTVSKAPPSTPASWEPIGEGHVIATDFPMSGMMRVLGWSGIDRPLVDQTCLTGRYTWDLRWRPDALAPDVETLQLPDLFTATREQLGLRLVPTKLPVQIWIVEHVEKPSPN